MVELLIKWMKDVDIMKEMRLIGNMAQKLSETHQYSDEEICNSLDCTMEQYQSFLNGRVFLAFDQLEKLADLFKVTIEELLAGDNDYYEQNVVHCMGEFEDTNNREMILDIIHDYLTLISTQK